jgi:hypothetical protein
VPQGHVHGLSAVVGHKPNLGELWHFRQDKGQILDEVWLLLRSWSLRDWGVFLRTDASN